MSRNRTARGIVLVPSLLLGGAFLAAAAWVDGPAAENRTLALVLGGVLMGAGLLAQLLPEREPEAAPPADASHRVSPEAPARPGKDGRRSALPPE